MPTKRQIVRLLFGGSWCSDVGPSLNSGPNQGGDMAMPFLTTAQNIFYEPTGAVHKAPGTTKLNSSAVASGAEIMGLYDFWRFGTGGAGTNKRVIHASTVIMADGGDGSFSNIQTGMTDNAVPCYTEFNGSLIMSNSAGDAVQSYDHSTCAALGGSPPAFQFSVKHRNRVWAAGVNATPNILHYSGSDDAAQWNGTGSSGTLTIPAVGNDGDRITGLCSIDDDLYVFRGPYYGSIYKVIGSSNSGADIFRVAANPLVRGIGAVWHSSIFRFRNDVGFMWSDGSIHSLSAALQYGGYGEAALSRPIRKYLEDNINLAALKPVSVAVNERRAFALICIPTGSATLPNQVLYMDFSRDQVWWAEWPAFGAYANCVARVVDSADSNKVKLFLGGPDGFVRKTDASDRSFDTTTAYTAKATLPFTNFGTALLTKTLGPVGVSVVPKGNYDLTLGVVRDKQPQDTVTLKQINTNTAWPFVDLFTEAEVLAGEFKNVQFEVSQGLISQDMEVHAITAEIEVGAEDTGQLPASGAA